MKLNIILSILFAIVTTFVSIHEVEHIVSDDESCLVCTLNNNLVSADISQNHEYIEFIHFANVIKKAPLLHSYFQEKNNSCRAPPFIS